MPKFYVQIPCEAITTHIVDAVDEDAAKKYVWQNATLDEGEVFVKSWSGFAEWKTFPITQEGDNEAQVQADTQC